MTIKRAVLLLALTLGLAAPAMALPSTDNGQISVAQVVDLIQRAPSENAARNAAIAYLAGVGETAAVLLVEAQRLGTSCSAPIGVSTDAALAVLSKTPEAKRGHTPATPILVFDLLDRAGCR
jgi:hypothetical protein